MEHTFTEKKSKAYLQCNNESFLASYKDEKMISYYTFVWATHTAVQLEVDKITVDVQPGEIVALTPKQHLKFLKGNDVRVISFNREFYCIKDHDNEIGCLGLLFFGREEIPIIKLSLEEVQSFESLYNVYIDEIQQNDIIQAEMLRLLTGRFILKLTKLFKEQKGSTPISLERSELVRKFTALVETNFNKNHNVSYYAELLNKSPKTLSNYFAQLDYSPLQIIHNRIVLESKRQLTYSSKSVKEIAYDLGFEDPSHLSRLFKKKTGFSPLQFKKAQTH